MCRAWRGCCASAGGTCALAGEHTGTPICATVATHSVAAYACIYWARGLYCHQTPNTSPQQPPTAFNNRQNFPIPEALHVHRHPRRPRPRPARCPQTAQTQLAHAAGVGVRFIVDLEAGKPTAQLGKTLQVLRCLGGSLQLLGLPGLPSSPPPELMP